MVNRKEVAVKRKKTIIPSRQKMKQIWEFQIGRKNIKGETKKQLHECLFLLCWKAGLRVSEAIKFDLNLEHPEKPGLFSLRGKGQKDRWTYLSTDLVKELKKRDWKPNNTNRIAFFKFLNNLKKEPELEINERVELSPHTLRRCFATYNMSNGMPLAVMQQFLGHSKISTTALYVKDCEVDNLLKWKPIE